jgi:hypothetical protein
LGKIICIGGDLIYFGGVTVDLVEKYNNQSLVPTYIYADGAAVDSSSNETEYTIMPEYPEFDEFDNPTEIS